MATGTYDSSLIIDSVKFNTVIQKLRSFFLSKNFIEVHAQNRLSILAACEDPFNLKTFDYAGKVWPLPQTSQMWLEYEILSKPHVPGYFSVSTSYRSEPNPVPGRHDLIFPMFEFECKGDMNDLVALQKELLVHLGYNLDNFYENDYTAIADEFGVKELEHEHEERLYKEKSPVVFIKNFPEFTSPFWNMKRNTENNTGKKVDVILSGMETFGSAERECDVDIMRNRFETIMNGDYRKKLIELFGEERVEAELKEYFDLTFIPRVGTGIGVTRLLKSMEKEGLL
jgi:aspartyl/asparaginyl-tRNA synthetase